LAAHGRGYPSRMANPFETAQKLVGFGIQQGTKVLGGAISTVQGLTGRGNDSSSEQEQQQQQPSRAQQQRQRQQKAAQQRRASKQPKDLDDVSITRKVETEIFRGADVDKGKIDVNTADGVVWLRGEAKNPEQVKELEAKAAAIPEVKRVENLLHLPKTPAPTRTDTPSTQRKTRNTKTSQAGRKVTTGRTTAERKTSSAPKEPAPADLAGSGSGRKPAPLGDKSGGGTTGSTAPTGGNGGAPSGTDGG
jgi:osmotically-inducible protein OsmY